MGVISENQIDLKGIKLHIVPTEKYKTNTIVFKMKAPLNKENVTITGIAALCFTK